MDVCACCGRSSRRVWGYAYANEIAEATYFVHWTPGHVADYGANFDMILGQWGEAAGPENRTAVALAYRLLDTGPSLMVIDAGDRPITQSGLVGRVLARVDVVNTHFAQNAFAVADAILAQDDRVVELLGQWRMDMP